MSYNEIRANVLTYDDSVERLQESLYTGGISLAAKKFGFRKMYFIPTKKFNLTGKVELFIEISVQPDSGGNFRTNTPTDERPTWTHVSDPRFESAQFVPQVNLYAYVDTTIEKAGIVRHTVTKPSVPKFYITRVGEDSLSLASYTNTEKNPDTWASWTLSEKLTKWQITPELIATPLARLYAQFLEDWKRFSDELNRNPALKFVFTDLRKVLKSDGSPLNPLAFSTLPESTRKSIQDTFDKAHGITRFENPLPIVNPDGTLKA